MKTCEQYDKISAGNNLKYKKRCRACEFPTCGQCKQKYVGERAIRTVVFDDGFDGEQWLCSRCRKNQA